MTRQLLAGALALLVVSSVDAAQTISATFENFRAGQSFKPSFTDPASNISFRNSTSSGAGFVIDGSDRFFGGGHYLTSGVGPTDGFGSFFGFSADFPAPANKVALDALYFGDPRSNVSLQGFNSVGTMVAQQAGPSGNSDAVFSLEIDSSQFDIKSIRVIVGGGDAGYDNIVATVLPEPGAVLCAAGLIAALRTGAGRTRLSAGRIHHRSIQSSIAAARFG